MLTKACKQYYLLGLCFIASACEHTDKIVGKVPAIPAIVATYPDPPKANGSLYNPAAGMRLALAEDRRARAVGDVLTVRLVERLQAEKSTGQDSSRKSNRNVDLPDAKPFSWLPEELFSGGSSSNFSGKGSAQQQNRLSGEITVFVTAVLPNGALAVAGDRRMTLTRGEEQVQLTGIVRPEDIGPDNKVLSTRIADAGLRYTGTGEVAAQARQGWLSRFFDIVTPF